MQIYTRTGDKGTTRIIGGSEVSKDDVRLNAYGTVDELNSVVGLVASHAGDWPEIQNELREIQHYLFDCGNDFATPHEKYPYRATLDMTVWLESRIDEYTKQAPEVESFILPGGTQLASFLHLARTVARRAERQTVTFMNVHESNPYALKFINRLSDYFFALARAINAQSGIEDILYKRSGRVFHNEITKEDLPDN